MSADSQLAGADTARPDLSGDEVAALLDKGDALAGPPGTPRPYDLAAPDRIVRGRMPVLDRLNERWVGAFQNDLVALVRQPVEVALQEVQLTAYGEWQAGMPVPSSLNVFTVKPWPRNALIAVDGRLLFQLVDTYYGGGSARKAQTPARESLTPTEQRLTRVVVDALADHFKRAFAPVAALDFQLVQTETNPNFLSIATVSEAVVVTRLEVLLGEVGGSISLVVPLASFDAVRDKLAEGLKTVSAETRHRWEKSLRAQLEDAQLALNTIFLETEITVRELLELKPGDILPIEMPKTATLCAGSRPLLRGKFGRSRGYNAVSAIEAVKTNGTKSS
jgi:flagellar motor switch protein FliM